MTKPLVFGDAKPSPERWWTTETGIRNSGGYIAHTISVLRYEGQDARYAFEVAQREADKQLIADAGTTYNETGLTPSQAAARVAELEAFNATICAENKAFVNKIEWQSKRIASLETKLKAEGGLS